MRSRNIMLVFCFFILLALLMSQSARPLPTETISHTNHQDTEHQSNYSPPLPSPGNELSSFSGLETAFYGMADDISVRNITGYADYIVCSHALWGGGDSIRENVRYLADHGVKVILDTAWWDVWPFPGAGVDGWDDMHKEDVVYGMNATEAVKYRIGMCIDNIGPEYIWGIALTEEQPGSGSFPWDFVTWYWNLFYDWIHEDYPGIKVLQWPAPYEFGVDQAHYLKADGIVYSNYNQNYSRIEEISYALKSAYPDIPLFFFISGVEHTDPWFTCHTPTYTKLATYTIAPYTDVISFWLTDDQGYEGWEVNHRGYNTTKRICNQLHNMDTNTIYGNTEWFESGFGNDTVTDSLDEWYRSYWRDEPADTDILIETASDHKVGDVSINLTSTTEGTHSFWWQYLGHEFGFADWSGAEPYAAFNMTDASRITFWVKGVGWENHPTAHVKLYLEKSNYPLGYAGNLTLPEITPYLSDGLWHFVSIDLPLDPANYSQWDGYCSQLRIEVEYPGSAVSNSTSILFDGWLVDSFDTGKAYGLNTPSDFVSVVNGTMRVNGSAYFESHFPQADAWYYKYSGTGTIRMLINDSWVNAPDEGMPYHWNVSAIQLANGTFEWVKVNAIPPLVEIQHPDDGDLLHGSISVDVDASDESGIQRVEFRVDGSLEYTDFTGPFTWNWDTITFSDGNHLLNVTAYAVSGATNYHDIQVTLDNTKPSISILNPINGTLASWIITFSATASDASGISHVDFYVDGALLTSDTTAPYGTLWDSQSTPDGLKNLTCVAVDQAGNVNSSYHQITIDNTGPTITIHSLITGDDQVFIAVNTSDSAGIDRVEFYINGSLEFTDYSYPYQFTWSSVSQCICI